jgi:uncharacterized protein YndB with AHSA1/START domain
LRIFTKEAGMADRIECEIRIAATPERVWEVLTDPVKVGEWFGMGKPAEIDLRPGGTFTLDFGPNGVFPNRIVAVEAPRLLSYRSASGFPGETPTDENSTLVAFTLEPDGGGTLLRLEETGFDAITLPPAQPQSANYDIHAQGWPYALERIRAGAQDAAA